MGSNMPSGIRQYEERFGAIAVAIGFITDDHLEMTLAIQNEEDRKQQRHRLLGEILIDMGLMTAAQVEEVLSRIFIKSPKEQGCSKPLARRVGSVIPSVERTAFAL